MRLTIFCLFVILPCLLSGQFAPGAGLPGSTAIPEDSPGFQSWAREISVERGFQQINDTALGKASFGAPEEGLGPPDRKVVSLGDAGTATLFFDPPIADGEGFDFAVFENGFPAGENYFLELAFVEVSSDGVYFHRFPAVSLTDTLVQIGPFDLLEAEKLNQLAGKYEVGYGTPFDLEELPDDPGVDKRYISHVRLVDVVGSLDSALASRDSQGRKINDPWPTAFESSGFDLDAVGAIHLAAPTFVREVRPPDFRIFPNPVRQGQRVRISPGNKRIRIHSVAGNVVFTGQVVEELDTQTWPTGLYLVLEEGSSARPHKLMIVP
jgi:hypothetical protein